MRVDYFGITILDFFDRTEEDSFNITQEYYFNKKDYIILIYIMRV